jgi:hypothetical protein
MSKKEIVKISSPITGEVKLEGLTRFKVEYKGEVTKGVSNETEVVKQASFETDTGVCKLDC